jgi:uncharacterized membrane protein YcfT
MSLDERSNIVAPIARVRVDWVDDAKGIAIVLVVLFHSGLLLMENNMAPDVWVFFGRVFSTLRMPLFFLASGLFAASVIARPWRDLWNSRLRLLVWMLVLWTIVRFGYFAVVPMDTRPGETNVTKVLLTLIEPSSGLWFLHALVLLFVIAKVMRNRIPVVVQIGVAAIVSFAFLSGVSLDSLSYNGIGRYLFFFLLGCYARQWILKFTERPRWVLMLSLTVLFATLATIIYRLHFERIPGVAFGLSLIAVSAGILIARCLAATPLTRVFTFIGKNTLPIYVTNVVIVAAIVTGLQRFIPDIPAGVALVLPVLVAAVTVGSGLLLWVGTRRLAPWLYLAPRFTRIPSRND